MESNLKIRSANVAARFSASFHQQRVSHRRVLRDQSGYPFDENAQFTTPVPIRRERHVQHRGAPDIDRHRRDGALPIAVRDQGDCKTA